MARRHGRANCGTIDLATGSDHVCLSQVTPDTVPLFESNAASAPRGHNRRLMQFGCQESCERPLLGHVRASQREVRTVKAASMTQLVVLASICGLIGWAMAQEPWPRGLAGSEALQAETPTSKPDLLPIETEIGYPPPPLPTMSAPADPTAFALSPEDYAQQWVDRENALYSQSMAEQGGEARNYITLTEAVGLPLFSYGDSVGFIYEVDPLFQQPPYILEFIDRFSGSPSGFRVPSYDLAFLQGILEIVETTGVMP